MLKIWLVLFLLLDKYEAPEFLGILDFVSRKARHVLSTFQISHLLVVDVHQRLTASQCLHHPWMETAAVTLKVCLNFYYRRTGKCATI